MSWKSTLSNVLMTETICIFRVGSVWEGHSFGGRNDGPVDLPSAILKMFTNHQMKPLVFIDEYSLNDFLNDGSAHNRMLHHFIKTVRRVKQIHVMTLDEVIEQTESHYGAFKRQEAQLYDHRVQAKAVFNRTLVGAPRTAPEPMFFPFATFDICPGSAAQGIVGRSHFLMELSHNDVLFRVANRIPQQVVRPQRITLEGGMVTHYSTAESPNGTYLAVPDDTYASTCLVQISQNKAKTYAAPLADGRISLYPTRKMPTISNCCTEALTHEVRTRNAPLDVSLASS